MVLLGPSLMRAAECEAILRTLPLWFGIEDALAMYAQDTTRLPTFAAEENGQIVAFLTLLEHFPQSWEVHCMAVHVRMRNQGHGTALLTKAQQWLLERGARFLQVKTVADTSKSEAYGETRKFYLARGFTPLEVFPLLWAPQNPALQLVKILGKDG